MLSIDLKPGDIVVDLIVDDEGNPETEFLKVLSVDVKAGNLIVDFEDGSHYIEPMDSELVEFSVFRGGEWL